MSAKIEHLTHNDFIFGLIYLKPVGISLRDDDFESRIKRVQDMHPMLKAVSRQQTTFPLNDKTSGVYMSLDAGMMAGILRQTGDWQYTHMTEYGREYVERKLRTQYSSEIFEKLRPIAESVWA